MIRSGKLCYCHKGESVGGSQALWKLLEKGEEVTLVGLVTESEMEIQ